MSVKDYYKILEVTDAASQNEIKKSYRRLALKYHPDKNFGQQLYEARFKEIQEAYDVLSDPKKRQDYNYRRNSDSRSHTQVKTKSYTPPTPQIILNQTIEFRRKVSVLDPDRVNKLAMFHQIQLLLSNVNVHVLQQHNDNKLNKRIIEEIMFCSRFLPFSNVEQICFQLTALAGTDNYMYQRIYNFSKSIRLKGFWHRYKIVAAILVSLLLCFAIYKVSAGF